MSVRSRARALPQSRRFRRVIFAFGGLALVQMLTGCLLDSQRPPLTGIPSGYGAGQGDAAPPALDWWRGFNSVELTGLIEEAQTSNFNIGAAIARIMQADALAKLAGAPLLPTLVLDANATRLRPAGGPVRENYRAALTAGYEIDFWGKNRAALIAAQETAAATRFAKEVVVLSTVVSVGTAYLQVLVVAGPDSHRAPEPRCRDPCARSDQAAVQRRHRLAARHRAAGERGGDGARQHPAVRPGPAPEHRRAGGADRAAAGRAQGEGRQPLFAAHSARHARDAVRVASPAPRHQAGRGQSGVGRGQRRPRRARRSSRASR